MRIENNGIRYFSFDELPFPKKKHKKNNKKIDELRERFEKRHKCIVCEQPMTWVEGTNVMACRNPECKGKKVEKVLPDETVKIEYKPYYHTLDAKGVLIAETLYSED